MEDTEIIYHIAQPGAEIAHLVDSFWMLQNNSDQEKEIVLLPDGRIDLFFSFSANEPFHVNLLGLETEAAKTALAAHTTIFAISFRLLAIEYILETSVAALIDGGLILPADFWGFSVGDTADFEAFCIKAANAVKKHMPEVIDPRKEKLFELIYATMGAMPVKELSEKVYWSARQINRYFTQQFGISLKAYCNILRFRASFSHIKAGKLFPEQNFSDQAHFIKAVKKLSGVLPKDLARNQNDRFIQLSTLPKK